MDILTRGENQDVFDHYELVSVIKSGSMGTVSCVRKNPSQTSKSKTIRILPKLFQRDGCLKTNSTPSSQKEYALKTIQLGRIPDEKKITALWNEIDILRKCDHPNIVRVFEVYSQRRQLYLIMELCTGGELSARLPYAEHQANKITREILSAVFYLHERELIHRDLKFENVLFESNHPDAQCKLIDFGLSRQFVPGEHMEEIVGTVYSSAPELLRGDYDNKADLWSVGVIAYMLRSGGKMPFQEKWRRFLIEKIQRAEYSFEDKCWDSVPVESKNFIASLLELDPTKRPTAEDALKNLEQLEEAISSPATLEELNSSSKVAEEVLDGLVKRKKTEFRRSQNTPLKNIALMAIAHYSDAEDIVNLRTAFQEYDQGGDGVINASEFKAAIQKYRKSFDETQADDLFRELDYDGDGVINYTEFIAATIEINGKIEEDRVAEAFDRLDVDNSGYISKEDLQQVLPKRSITDLEAFLSELDENHDGKVSFKELLSTFHKTKTRRNRKLFQMFRS